MRDEDEDESRRVKGLYELIRAEGMMIEDGWEGVAIFRNGFFAKKRNAATTCHSVVRSNGSDRLIPFTRRLCY